MTPRLHLVGADRPPVSPSCRRLLDELARMEQPLDDARADMRRALATADPDAAVSCARRLVSIACLLDDAAQAAGRDLAS